MYTNSESEKISLLTSDADDDREDGNSNTTNLPLPLNNDSDKHYYGKIMKDDSGEKKQIIDHDVLIENQLDDDSGNYKLNNFQSLMNLLKGNVGTGIFALPVAFKFGGLWVSLFGILIIGIIAIHCMHLLVKSSRFASQRTGKLKLDYGHVVEEVFLLAPSSIKARSRGMKITTYVFLSLTQFGFCSAYIVFIAFNIQWVVECYSPSTHWPPQAYQSIVVLFLIPYLCIRHLKVLAFFSGLANILVICGLLIVLYDCVINLPPVSSRPWFGSWTTFPLFFSIAVFTFEGIGLILPIQGRMKSPQDFGGWFGIINLGMVIATCAYSAIGFYGYLKHGDGVKGSITLNLPNTTFYNIVRLAFALSIFFTYAIQFYVPIEFIWSNLQPRFLGWNDFLYRYGEYCLRMVFLILTFIVAAVVPYLELVISLVGALASTSVAFIFPALLDIIVCYSIKNLDDGGGSDGGGGAGGDKYFKLKIFKDVVIVLVGFLGLIIGSVVTVIEIVNVSKM